MNGLFNKGFPSNIIPVVVPSTGMYISLRETTITELKSMSKIVIDNYSRRQMDVIYDATAQYLQSMILTDGVDVGKFTEFDKLYCLMVFFQVSFYRDPIQFNCPKCKVEINYRYDMSRYLEKMKTAYVENQTIEIPHKSSVYTFEIGWPTVDEMSMLYRDFYSQEEITPDMEQTQFGIEFVMSFVKKIVVRSAGSRDDIQAEADLTALDTFREKMECINAIPSIVMFDDESGVFSKITGYFINRLENCFSFDRCPQCHAETEYGLPQSSFFYGMFYGTIKSIFKFIMQVECLLLFRYDQVIFDKEQYMTYNDLSNLMHQLSSTVEKDNQDRQKVGRDHLYKGLWLIREILNTMIFPEDKKH